MKFLLFSIFCLTLSSPGRASTPTATLSCHGYSDDTQMRTAEFKFVFPKPIIDGALGVPAGGSVVGNSISFTVTSPFSASIHAYYTSNPSNGEAGLTTFDSQQSTRLLVVHWGAGNPNNPNEMYMRTDDKDKNLEIADIVKHFGSENLFLNGRVTIAQAFEYVDNLPCDLTYETP